MNDLLRPSIYSAWHTIVNTVERTDTDTQTYDIVGPVCESGDFLGKDRSLSPFRKGIYWPCILPVLTGL